MSPEPRDGETLDAIASPGKGVPGAHGMHACPAPPSGRCRPYAFQLLDSLVSLSTAWNEPSPFMTIMKTSPRPWLSFGPYVSVMPSRSNLLVVLIVLRRSSRVGLGPAASRAAIA